MLKLFLNLYTENQTSSTGTLIFTLLSIMVFLMLALTFYILIMLLIWRLKLHKTVSLPRLFLPSVKQLKEYFGEYGLGAVTSLILAITINVKHGLVEEIMNQKITGLTLSADQFMPAHFLGSDLGNKMTSLTVDYFLQPLLKDGRTEEAELLGMTSVKAFEKTGLATFLTEPALLTVAGILALCYLIWMVVLRTKQLKNDPNAGGVVFKRQFRGLLILAVCIALLLATPTLVSNPALAESVQARATQAIDGNSVENPAITDLMGKINFEARRQRDLLKFLEIFNSAEGEEPGNILDALATINTNLSALEDRLDTKIRTLETQGRDMNSSVSDARASVDNLQSRLEELQSSISETENRLREVMNQLAADLRENHQVDIGKISNEHTSLISDFNQLKRLHDQQFTELSNRFGTLASQEALGQLRRSLNNLLEEMSAYKKRLEQLQNLPNQLSQPGFLVVISDSGCGYSIEGAGIRTNGTMSATWPLRPGTYTINPNSTRCSIRGVYRTYEISMMAGPQDNGSRGQLIPISQASRPPIQRKSFVMPNNSVAINSGQVRAIQISLMGIN